MAANLYDQYLQGFGQMRLSSDSMLSRALELMDPNSGANRQAFANQMRIAQAAGPGLNDMYAFAQGAGGLGRGSAMAFANAQMGMQRAKAADQAVSAWNAASNQREGLAQGYLQGAGQLGGQMSQAAGAWRGLDLKQSEQDQDFLGGIVNNVIGAGAAVGMAALTGGTSLALPALGGALGGAALKGNYSQQGTSQWFTDFLRR